MSHPVEDQPELTPGRLVTVDDPDDPRLDLYRHLNDRAGRARVEDDRSVFVVEGRLAVERLLTSGYRVRSLLVDDHQATVASHLVTATRARGAPVFVGSRAVVAGTVGFALHRGVVAVADRPSPADPERVVADVVGRSGADPGRPVVAVLEGLNDHENIGSLFRNAAAFGVGAVLLDPTCADPLYRRSVRVSVGHVLHVPFARLGRWPGALDQVRATGMVVAALSPHPTARSGSPVIDLAGLRARLGAADHPSGVALVFGAEGPGLSEAALSSSDLVVTIPMADGVDSLNVATAAAVAFHAVARR